MPITEQSLIEFLRPHVAPNIPITPASAFVDLELRGLEYIEFIMAVEEGHGISIPDDVCIGVRTVGELARAIDAGGCREIGPETN